MKQVILFGMLGMTAVAAIAEVRVVHWNDLAVEEVDVDNPFSNLASDQIQRLAKLLRYESQPLNALGTENKLAAKTLRDELTAEGLDVDWLFEQRLIVMQAKERAATETNTEIVGQNIRLPGYVLPLAWDGLKTTEFLLVPTVGACIHVPPPPPNQMVHVTYPDGFEVSGLFTPVWITGEIQAEAVTEDVTYSDGSSEVQIGYIMNAKAVEVYTQ